MFVCVNKIEPGDLSKTVSGIVSTHCRND